MLMVRLAGFGLLVQRCLTLPSSDPVHLSFAECHEQDARHQHPVRPDEGQPPLLDPESVFLQRYRRTALTCLIFL